MKKIVFFVLSVLLVSCNAPWKENKSSEASVINPEEATNCYTIRIENPGKNGVLKNISDICESVQYIPIETTGEILIKNIIDIDVVLPYIFLATSGQVYIFDFNGKLVRKISGPGNEQGQYNIIKDMLVDRSDTSIYVLSILDKKINHFSFNGHLIESFSSFHDYPNERIEKIGDTIFLSYSDFITKESEAQLLMIASFNEDFELVREYPSRLQQVEKGTVTLMIPNEVLYSDNESIYFKQVRNDTVYRIKGPDVTPYIIFRFPEYKMPLDEFTYEHFVKQKLILNLPEYKMPMDEFTYANFVKHIYGDKYIYFQDVVESDKLIFFTYKYSNTIVRSIFDKQKLELISPLYSDSDFRINDDLNYNLPFWPVALEEGNLLLGWLEPALLTQSQLSVIPCMGDAVSQSDNPVIQIGVIRK